MRVMRNHRYAAYNAADNYEGLEIKPMGIDQALCPEYLLKAACNAWDGALQLGEEHGYRNAQATVIAPTGTIGLLMDCDTTGVCLLYTSPSPRDRTRSRMPSSA